MNFYEDNFVQLCLDKDVSPRQALLAMGLSPSASIKWQEGGMPNSTTLAKMSRYFGVTTDEIINYKPKEVKADNIAVDDQVMKLNELLASATPEQLEFLQKLTDYLHGKY